MKLGIIYIGYFVYSFRAVISQLQFSTDKRVNISVTCDNELKGVYVDGIPRTLQNANEYTVADFIETQKFPSMIAIDCMDHGRVAGILMSLNSGEKSDGTWRCHAFPCPAGWEQPHYDDSDWEFATEHAVHKPPTRWKVIDGIADNAWWIWLGTRESEDLNFNQRVCCRKAPCGCDGLSDASQEEWFLDIQSDNTQDPYAVLNGQPGIKASGSKRLFIRREDSISFCLYSLEMSVFCLKEVYIKITLEDGNTIKDNIAVGDFDYTASFGPYGYNNVKSLRIGSKKTNDACPAGFIWGLKLHTCKPDD